MLVMLWTCLELMLQQELQEGATIDDAASTSAKTHIKFVDDWQKELEGNA